jgi:hypothetical protein
MRKTLFAMLALFTPALAWGYAKDCPQEVDASVAKVYPGSKMTYCFGHKYPTGTVYEVKITTKDKHKLELHTRADGTVLADRESMPAKNLPKEIVGAFEKKYERMHPKLAWRDTLPDGTVKYLIEYSDEDGRHYVIYTATAEFVSRSDDKDSER